MSKLYEFKNVAKKISFIDKPNICAELKKLHAKHEDIYVYMDKLNPEQLHKYKQIEKYINSLQKNLQIYLLKKHNININNSYVSRAWIKLYELYIETNFFKDIKNPVRGFHICEAPGNFVRSTKYYLSQQNKKYKWSAQSLKDSSIFDEYNFIEKTKKHWDFGGDDTGNIITNLPYYVNKYKNVDVLIGDCGGSYGKKIGDISEYQILYSLLIPKRNCVIKTYASQTSNMYLSLLYLLYCKYEHLYIFKSSRNFWSPEIYIVGINHLGLTETEKQHILKLKPVQVPEQFCKVYSKIINDIIEDYAKVKKQFVDYILFPKTFDRNKIANLIETNNIKWLEKYMPDKVADYKIKFDDVIL